MKCILLCAGYATRLHPLTLNTSKSLLNVAGKPLIEHILDKIECVDIIDEILIVTNNKFCGEFEEWNSNYTSSKRIKIINDFTSSNEDRLGAVGDIVFVLKQRRINEDVLVVGGDNLFDFNLNPSLVGVTILLAKIFINLIFQLTAL